MAILNPAGILVRNLSVDSVCVGGGGGGPHASQDDLEPPDSAG